MSEYDDEGIHAILNGRFELAGHPVSNYVWLDSAEKLQALMTHQIIEAGATIMSVQVHTFQPQGVTITFTLSESHATIHTYPEHGTFFMDMFTCGSIINPEDTLRRIAFQMGTSAITCDVISRKAPPSRI